MSYLLDLRILKCIFLQFSFILVFIISSHFITASCDYEQFGYDHTMCRYTTPACTILRSGLNEEEKHEMIRAHNKARQKVANGHQTNQPTASNMREVDWSNELAMIAQKWAEQCTYAHDHNRRTRTFQHVGQNVFMSYSNKNKNSNADVKEAVQAWYNEADTPGFNPVNINPFHYNLPVGHYTQLVWADVDLIGCGFVHFQKNDRLYYKHTICNYAPGGNILNGMMYQVGIQCKNCTDGCSKKYSGLCNFRQHGSYIDQMQQQPDNEKEDQEIEGRPMIIIGKDGKQMVINAQPGMKTGLVDNDNEKFEAIRESRTVEPLEPDDDTKIRYIF